MSRRCFSEPAPGRHPDTVETQCRGVAQRTADGLSISKIVQSVPRHSDQREQERREHVCERAWCDGEPWARQSDDYGRAARYGPVLSHIEEAGRRGPGRRSTRCLGRLVVAEIHSGAWVVDDGRVPALGCFGVGRDVTPAPYTAAKWSSPRACARPDTILVGISVTATPLACVYEALH